MCLWYLRVKDNLSCVGNTNTPCFEKAQRVWGGGGGGRSRASIFCRGGLGGEGGGGALSTAAAMASSTCRDTVYLSQKKFVFIHLHQIVRKKNVFHVHGTVSGEKVVCVRSHRIMVIIDMCCNKNVFTLIAAVEHPLLGSTPGRQLLENEIPETVFSCVCVCAKRAKREVEDYQPDTSLL